MRRQQTCLAAAIALALSLLIFGLPRPAWANGAMYALSASAFGLFFYTSVRNVPGTRKTRFGPVMLALAFVAHGLLAVDLLLVLLGVGGVSLLCNWPGNRKPGSNGRERN